MKKECLKRIPKKRIRPRECLGELQFNTIEGRRMLKKKLTPLRRQSIFLDSLPSVLQIEILSFFTAQELLHLIQLISKSWQRLANEPVLWRWLECSNLPHKWRIQFLRCLAERRSKGKVYSGVLRSSQTPVTVRRVQLDVTNAGYDDGLPSSLLRELAYLCEISHPNVNKLMGAELQGKTLSVFFEQGDYNLKEYLRKFGPPDQYRVPKQAIQGVMRQLLKAVEFLHRHNLIHRNLKPDNVFISRSGNVKISDFALARLMGVPRVPYTPEDPKERDRSGREAKRLWYRAPELLLRKEMYGHEVDMWTLGCLLGEMALGEAMFPGDNEIEQLFKVFNFTGVPEVLYPIQTNAFPKWEPVQFEDVMSDPHSHDFKKVIATLLPARRHTFKMLRCIGNIIGSDGLNLLQGLLHTDTEQRLTVEQALRHPFISESGSEEGSYSDFWLGLENRNVCYSDYLITHSTVTPTMRSILVDWLIDVSVHFELTDDTLHIAIGLIDRALGVLPIDRSKLQLLGVSCMKIAEVLNEKSKEYYRQENSVEYAYITADEYTPEEVVNMEKQVLNALDFHVLTPNILTFLKSRTQEMDQFGKTLASYLADLLLLNYETIQFKRSELAEAIVYMTLLFQNHEVAEDTGRIRREINHVRDTWIEARSSYARYESINQKFNSISPQELWPPNL